MIEQHIQKPHHLEAGSFKISPDRLQIQFQCTVCLNPINDCYITRCGHVYCKGCIQQTINRHHRCPFCNQQLKDFKDDVFKNYHFNTIKKIVEDQIRKQNDKYLGKIFSKNIKIVQDLEGQAKLMLPVQKKILEQFQDSLLKYRKYLLEVYSIAKQTQQKKLLYGLKQVKNNDELISQIQNFVLDSLPAPIISPQLISQPTQIQLILPTKKTHKTIIKLSPISQFSTILPYLQSICSQLNVRIEGQIPNQLLINGQRRSIEQRVGLLAGKAIKVEGIPIQINIYCYTHFWQMGKITNFYSCKECKTKWICQNCSILCHKGHQTVLQLKDHKADWACCYCVTKCDCKALNKNSKIKM